MYFWCSSNTSSKAMTTTGTSTTSRSYEASEAVKSNLFDHDEWETNEDVVDSAGSLLRKPKQIQPANYANFQMVISVLIYGASLEVIRLFTSIKF